MEKKEVYQDSPDQEQVPVTNAGAVIRHFQESLYSGKHWYSSLLESIGLWTEETEVISGCLYRYLIEGEAFDWLLLAERLCNTVNGLVPENEKTALLFRCRPPLELSGDEFKNLIGVKKYHQFLNYFYGVTVEQALVQVVREEVRKERRANGWSYQRGEEDETFIRIYDNTEKVLLKQFRLEKTYPDQDTSDLTEMKEFAYWCFKLRLKTCEKARVASDTTKALGWLKKTGAGFMV
ncbi:MAG: hypothetical protein JXA46_10310 [Dehalococcoidales bacterium]|nr:hypothetical protein [Dehalococcoidales bacterium]